MITHVLWANFVNEEKNYWNHL